MARRLLVSLSAAHRDVTAFDSQVYIMMAWLVSVSRVWLPCIGPRVECDTWRSSLIPRLSSLGFSLFFLRYHLHPSFNIIISTTLIFLCVSCVFPLLSHSISRFIISIFSASGHCPFGRFLHRDILHAFTTLFVPGSIISITYGIRHPFFPCQRLFPLVSNFP